MSRNPPQPARWRASGKLVEVGLAKDVRGNRPGRPFFGLRVS